MAGNYTDVPSWRIPWDRDNTQLLITNTAWEHIFDESSGSMQTINNENPGSVRDYDAVDRGLVFMFPRLMDLDGMLMMQNDNASGNASLTNVQWSPDSTNGLDGQWSSISGYTYIINGNKTHMRENIGGTSILGARAVRMIFRQTSVLHTRVICVHMYGEPSAGENTDRLSIWNPTTDNRVAPAYFDWGNAPRDSSEDRSFRVKNRSSSLTANDIIVNFETLTDTSPSVDGWHLISDDGGANFFAQVNIGSLSPGAISGELILRRATPSDAKLSLWWGRVNAVATSWS